MASLPDMHAAEPIPAAAMNDVLHLLQTGDLFRYTAKKDAPVSLLEAEFAQRLGSRFALAVSSCSAALFLSLRSLDLPHGARVLIPGFTFAAVPSAVIHADCVPVLCECGPDYRLDMGDFAAKLPGCAAVIVSHMRGHTSDMDAIMALCEAAGVPVIEDAAHSLGTRWRGRNIGTIGAIGCFSFQSYKLLNAGEGGILVTDDADLVARAIIMSGAYEHNWQKHPVLTTACARWQNRLPLYNMRLGNLSAALIRAQLPELDRRVRDGRRNHDHVAALLNALPWLTVPAPLSGEERAPDSIQFNLSGVGPDAAAAFVARAAEAGVQIQIFGQSRDNARAFWNWEFLPEKVELPKTRAMLTTACDMRLPARLTIAECDAVAGAVTDAITQVMAPARATGT